MSNIINFNDLIEINKILKDKSIEYTLHGNAGCSSCGVQLKGYGKVLSSESICEVINVYLKHKWIKVTPIEKGSYYLNVE